MTPSFQPVAPNPTMWSLDDNIIDNDLTEILLKLPPRITLYTAPPDMETRVSDDHEKFQSYDDYKTTIGDMILNDEHAGIAVDISMHESVDTHNTEDSHESTTTKKFICLQAPTRTIKDFGSFVPIDDIDITTMKTKDVVKWIVKTMKEQPTHPRKSTCKLHNIGLKGYQNKFPFITLVDRTRNTNETMW